MTEKRIITFSPEGFGLGISIVFDAPKGARILPDSMPSNMASRYALKDDVITDLYPEKTDEEVVKILQDQEEKTAQEARAARQGMDVTTLEGAKAFKIKQVRQHFNQMIEALKSDAAPYEVETWAVQRDEYARWVADPQAATPYVDGLCAGRGVTKAELMPKIGAKVAGLASIQGMQHATEKEIEAATTAEEALAVELPGGQ